MAVYKTNMVDIDLGKGQIHRAFLNHSIGTYDQQADRFGIRVFRDGEPVNLTGVAVQGVFMPPQGSPIAITGSTYTSVSGNTAEVILPQACYNYEGTFTLAIKLVDSGNSVTGTMRIVDGMVDNTHASGTVAPTGAVPTYQEVLAVYDAAIAAIDDVNELKSAITLDEELDFSYFKDKGAISVEYEQGGIGENGITLTTTNARIRSKYFIPATKYKYIAFKITSGYKFRIFWYDESKAKLGSVAYRTTDLEQDLSSAYYFKVVIGKTDDSDIAISEGATAVSVDGLTDRFMFNGVISTLGYTKLTDCKKAGWYGCGSTYLSSITDLPADFPNNKALHLVVYAPALGLSTYIRQEISTNVGDKWNRLIDTNGNVLADWDNNSSEDFIFRGFINSLGYTKISDCRRPGWYGCSSTYLTSITDLPTGFPTDQSLHLVVYNPTTGNSGYERQEISTNVGSKWNRIIQVSDGAVAVDWTKDTEGQRYANRPSSGYENFTFPVSVGVPDDDTGSLALQDSATTENDRAILILPTTYTPTGEPTRMVIVGCGTSGAIGSGSTDIAANSMVDSAILKAEGYAVLQVNGSPGFTANTSHGDPMSLRSYAAAYKYVTEKYNIARDGVFVTGYSQGGGRVLQLAFTQMIPVKAAAVYASAVEMWKGTYTYCDSTIRLQMMRHFGFVEKEALPEVAEMFGLTPGTVVEEPTTFTEAHTIPNDSEKAYILNNADKWAGYNQMTAKASNKSLIEKYSVWTAPDAPASDEENALYNDAMLMPCPVKLFSSTGDTSCPYKWHKLYYDMLNRGGSIAELRVVNNITHNEFITARGAMEISVTAKDGNTYTTPSLVWEAMLFFRRWDI